MRGKFQEFRDDESALAPILWIVGIAGITVAAGWSSNQVANGFEAAGEFTGSLLYLIAGGTVMLVGGFLVVFSAIKETPRFIPLGLVLMFLGLPLLGFDYAALQQIFGGSQ